MSTLTLSKFDVAERQLLVAIRLFFAEDDPISIHTLVEAAFQVLFDIRERYGAISIFREGDLIREEYRVDWLRHLAKSKNFFKHADRDPDSTHEFKVVSNDYSILDAINLYGSIKLKWVPETLAFQIWFGMAYPHLLKDGSELDAIFRNAKENGKLPRSADKQMMLDVIHSIRSGKIALENIELKLGI